LDKKLVVIIVLAAVAPTPLPTPSVATPPPQDVASLSEEQAAAEVDASVQEADEAVQEADEAAQEASSAGELSADKAEALLQATAEAEALVAAAEQTAAASWSGGIADYCRRRAEEAAGVAPTEVSGTRRGALTSLQAYLDSVRGALQGGLTADGIAAVSQTGANAAASLEAAGGALAGLSGQVESLTRQVVRGDAPAARATLPQLEQALP